MSSTLINELLYGRDSREYRQALWREEKRRRREAERQRRHEEYLQREEERQRRHEEYLQREAERQRREEEQRRRDEAERKRREEEQRRKREAERKRRIAVAWDSMQKSLHVDIRNVHSAPEREELLSSANGLKSSFIAAMNSGDNARAEKLISDMRQKIMSVQSDEKLLASRKSELLSILLRLKTEAPAGFSQEIDSIISEAKKEERSALNAQLRLITSLTGQAGKLASVVAQANSLSLDGLIEEAVFIPPVSTQDNDKSSAELHELIEDICDFGGRIEFYDEQEADKIKPLVAEAKCGAVRSRLELIRTQVKTVYGQVKECAVLTDRFKQDIREFLPMMQAAQGAEDLCLRMEDLLTARVITRETYSAIYTGVKSVFMEQSEAIESAIFAEKVSRTLQGMGYTLIGEDGAELELGKPHVMDTPFDGYRMRVKVGKDGTIATRLVRVVGSEAEKVSVSEYQKQADIEAGKKFCGSLEKFYKALEAEGITTDTVLRKEPEEEPLDIVVDETISGKNEASQRKHKALTSGVQQEHLQERRL